MGGKSEPQQRAENTGAEATASKTPGLLVLARLGFMATLNKFLAHGGD